LLARRPGRADGSAEEALDAIAQPAQAGGVRGAARGILFVAPRALPARGGALRLEPGVVLLLQPGRVTSLAGGAGLLEAAGKGARLAGHPAFGRLGRLETIPGPARLLQPTRGLLALGRLDRLAQRPARGEVARHQVGPLALQAIALG